MYFYSFKLVATSQYYSVVRVRTSTDSRTICAVEVRVRTSTYKHNIILLLGNNIIMFFERKRVVLFVCVEFRWSLTREEL